MAAATLQPCAATAQDREQARARLNAAGIELSASSLVQYASQGDLVTTDLLLATGLAVDEREPRRRVSALHTAAAQGHVRVVERLLGARADLDAQDWQGLTPLINAAFGGHLQVAQRLLAQGARVNLRPTQGPTALIAAVQGGHMAMVELLVLKHGADVNLADCFGTTPLAAAKRAGRAAMVALLQQAGATA